MRNIMKKEKKGNGQDLSAQPERQVSRFRREMEQAFDRAFSTIERDPWRALEVGLPWPRADVSENGKNFTVRLDVPGLDPDDIDIEITGNILTIRGDRAEEDEARDGDTYRNERYTGSFARSFTVPTYTDPDGAEAKYNNGVLSVTLPKIAGKQPKRLRVSADR